NAVLFTYDKNIFKIIAIGIVVIRNSSGSAGCEIQFCTVGVDQWYIIRIGRIHGFTKIGKTMVFWLTISLFCAADHCYAIVHFWRRDGIITRLLVLFHGEQSIIESFLKMQRKTYIINRLQQILFSGPFQKWQ